MEFVNFLNDIFILGQLTYKLGLFAYQEFRFMLTFISIFAILGVFVFVKLHVQY